MLYRKIWLLQLGFFHSESVSDVQAEEQFTFYPDNIDASYIYMKKLMIV